MTLAQSTFSLAEVQALADDGEKASRQCVRLLTTLQSEDDELCGWVADALRQIECVPVDAVEALVRLTGDPHPPVAGWACRLITRVPAPRQGLQAVVSRTLATHPSLSVRQSAAAALSEFETLSAETVQALQAAAGHEDPRLARIAAQTLGRRCPA